MADKSISDLIQALQITGEDLFVLEQNGEAKKLKGKTLLDFITLNVVSVTVTTLPAGSSATATYDTSTNTLALGIPQGIKGDTGATGATGPANVLTIGSVTSGNVASATITGEAPNQVLNLVLEKGEQGPEGPVGGSSNFVRYDAAQTLTDAQKTRARANIGAAPDGFGLGTSSQAIIADWDEALSNGWWRDGDDNLLNRPFPGLWGIGLTTNYAENSHSVQSAFWVDSDGSVYQKIRGRYSNNTWGPWEWVNPPMRLGVEYRTTERYFGNPVYVKLVDCGTLPNATTKKVEYGDSGCSPIFGYGISNSSTFPSFNYGNTLANSFDSPNIVSLWFIGNEVSIACGGDRSSVEAYVFVKYYKTTD